MSDRAFASERVLVDGTLKPRAVLVKDGRIEAVVERGAVPAPVHVEDFGKQVILPGLVDCHVHVNEPGRTEWEGFDTATRAAASGGITTIVDMPLNSTPVTTSKAAFETKLLSTVGKLHVDCGFWGGVVPDNEDQHHALADMGVLGSKAFLVHSGIDDFPNVDSDQLRRAMPRLKEAGIPLLAHAELDIGSPLAKLPANDYRSWLNSRPNAWEDEAIRLLIELCRQTRCPVHIVHLSSASAVDMLREARRQGLPVTVETCPHYLCLFAEDVPLGGTVYKCAPPIRERDNAKRLWDALEEGVIDFVISDHSPCTPALKHIDDGDFLQAWGGIASLSLGLSCVWTEARRRGIGIERLGQWFAAGPASFAGLAKRKGAIEAGLDADFCVWDPDASFEVQKEDLRFRHPVSPYLGQQLVGTVTATVLRGQRVYDGRTLLVESSGRTQLHRDA